MKKQALFSSEDKSKKLKCHLLQFLFGALRVKTNSFKKICGQGNDNNDLLRMNNCSI